MLRLVSSIRQIASFVEEDSWLVVQLEEISFGSRNVASDELEVSISARLEDHGVIGIKVVIRGPLEGEEVFFAGLKVFDKRVQIVGPNMGHKVHEGVEGAEVTGSFGNLLLDVEEGQLTVWVLSAVDSVKTKSTVVTAILELNSSVIGAFTLTWFTSRLRHFNVKILQELCLAGVRVTASPG